PARHPPLRRRSDRWRGRYVAGSRARERLSGSRPTDSGAASRLISLSQSPRFAPLPHVLDTSPFLSACTLTRNFHCRKTSVKHLWRIGLTVIVHNVAESDTMT